jgi:hypothetical protein
MGKTKKVNLFAELREGLEEMVAIEKAQKKPVRVHCFSTSATMKAGRAEATVSRRRAQGKRKDSG